MKSKVLIVYTGGTIGMMQDSGSSALIPVDFRHIHEKVPELKNFDFEIDTISFSPPIDSSDMTPEIWIRMVSIVEENYDQYSGFVILHGTDTMAYTASALSFMFHNLDKPVILTGSQLPLGTMRTDGKENLITAIEIAAAQQNGQALVPEVAIFFQDKLYRGNRTTKYNAENFRAFRSDNYPALAESGLHIRYNYPYIRYSTKKEVFYTSKRMEAGVAVLKIFPGIRKEVLEAVLYTPGLKALVLETYGSGNAPTAAWFIETLESAIRRGIIVLNVTQCLAGSVEMWRYHTGNLLSEIGVTGGYDITTEAAVTKLMYLFGNMDSLVEIKSSLNKSLRGEINIQ